MRTKIIRSIIFIITSIIICSCQENSGKESLSDENAQALHLTKNALWDEPAMKEKDSELLSKNIARELGQDYRSYVKKSKEGKATLGDMQKMYDLLSDSKSKYAGTARLKILNNILINTPMEEFNVDFITHCLSEGYKTASGEVPVSQSLFFNFWENCMVGYSNINAYDKISVEAQKLLEICENQNIPMGVMFSYKALAGNLQDHSDYSTAIMEYDKARNVAHKMFPSLISDDWDSVSNIQKNINNSDYLLCYLDLLSSQLYCYMRAEDYTWIKSNETYIAQMIDGTKDFPSIQLSMLFNMAQYYDIVGNDSLFNKYLAKAREYKPVTDPKQATYIDMGAVSWYNYTMALHELKLNNPAKALSYMNDIHSDWLNVQDCEIFADIYSRMGNYKEAHSQLLNLVKHNKRDLNGRNRSTLNSMSNMIEGKKKDMQMMQIKIDQQNEQLVYNGIIMALTFILIIVLSYFLYHQRKLNKNLSLALDEAEAANKAKDVFLKNMTHEIHTPIHQIFGLAQVISDRSAEYDEESIRSMCDYICESSMHLTKIADNIIEVADKVSKLDNLEETESVIK